MQAIGRQWPLGAPVGCSCQQRYSVIRSPSQPAGDLSLGQQITPLQWPISRQKVGLFSAHPRLIAASRCKCQRNLMPLSVVQAGIGMAASKWQIKDSMGDDPSGKWPLGSQFRGSEDWRRLDCDHRQPGAGKTHLCTFCQSPSETGKERESFLGSFNPGLGCIWLSGWL